MTIPLSVPVCRSRVHRLRVYTSVTCNMAPKIPRKKKSVEIFKGYEDEDPKDYIARPVQVLFAQKQGKKTVKAWFDGIVDGFRQRSGFYHVTFEDDDQIHTKLLDKDYDKDWRWPDGGTDDTAEKQKEKKDKAEKKEKKGRVKKETITEKPKARGKKRNREETDEGEQQTDKTEKADDSKSKISDDPGFDKFVLAACPEGTDIPANSFLCGVCKVVKPGANHKA